MDARTYNASVTALFNRGGTLRRILEDAPRESEKPADPQEYMREVAGMVWEFCPCGCGKAGGVCEARRDRVRRANEAMEF